MTNDAISRLRTYRDSQKAEMDRLDRKIAELLDQRNRLEAQVSALDHAINMLLTPVDEVQAPNQAGKKRVTNKGIVLSMLEHAGRQGASVSDIIERHPELKRGTISSQLSHWKAEELVTYHDGRYYLPKYAPVSDNEDTGRLEAGDAASEPSARTRKEEGVADDIDSLLN